MRDGGAEERGGVEGKGDRRVGRRRAQSMECGVDSSTKQSMVRRPLRPSRVTVMRPGSRASGSSVIDCGGGRYMHSRLVFHWL